MKGTIATIMGFFSGFLIYFIAAMVFSGKGAPSSAFVFITSIGGWVVTVYLMLKGAKTVSKVVSRGFLIGAAEWLAVIPAGLIFSGKAVTETVGRSGGSDAAAIGAAIGGGLIAFLTGGVAVAMALICLIGFAVTYFIAREMKPEADASVESKSPETKSSHQAKIEEVIPVSKEAVQTSGTKNCPFCGEEILAVAIKCKHCGSDLSTVQAVPPQQQIANVGNARQDSVPTIQDAVASDGSTKPLSDVQRPASTSNDDGLPTTKTHTSLKIGAIVACGLAIVAAISFYLYRGSNPVGYEVAKPAFDQKDYPASIAACQRDADKGEPQCLNLLGVHYMNGLEVPRDLEKARELFEKAAMQGNAKAQFNLGGMYARGQGVSKDAGMAFWWIQQAAAQGYANAQNMMGIMYEGGEIISKDAAKAVEWWQKAAAQGDASAQNNLGVMYERGQGVPKDAAKAIEWWKKAAAQGNVYAQRALGLVAAAQPPQSSSPLFGNTSTQDTTTAQKSIHPGSEALYPVPLGDKHGYIDRQGKIVINPQYDYAFNFAEGLAAVGVGKKWGYIDKQGKFVIKPQFDRASNFAEGLAAVELGDKWGYIDKQGKYVINPQFDNAIPFVEGLAQVEVGDKWGVIDKQGKYVINPQFGSLCEFAEGLAAVELGNKWGFIDKQGKFVIKPQFDGVNESHTECDGKFAEGLAAVKLGNKWGYIDKQGKYVINSQFDRAFDFAEGLAAVGVGKKWGYIDKQGKYVINPQYDYAFPFAEGLAPVQVGDKWGYIDKQGKYVINPRFDWVQWFAEGLAAVQVGDKWGYIDKRGKFVINSQFDGARPFADGIAEVEVGNKLAYIDSTGKYIFTQPELRSVPEQRSQETKHDPLAQLEKAAASQLRPDGELAEIFNLGSEYTSVQRENKEKAIKGQVVAWTLPVYDVKRRSNDEYRVQTSQSSKGLFGGSDFVGTWVYIKPRNTDETSLLERLKTGDTISFKGYISDVSLRNIEIKPAILWTDSGVGKGSKKQSTSTVIIIPKATN